MCMDLSDAIAHGYLFLVFMIYLASITVILLQRAMMGTHESQSLDGMYFADAFDSTEIGRGATDVVTPASLFGEKHGFTERAPGVWTRDLLSDEEGSGTNRENDRRVHQCPVVLQVFYVCEGDGQDYELFEVDESGSTVHWLLTNGPCDRRDMWFTNNRLKTLSFTGNSFGGDTSLVAPRVTCCPKCLIPVVNFDETMHVCMCAQ